MAGHKKSKPEPDSTLNSERSSVKPTEKKEQVEETIERAKKLRKKGKFDEGIDQLVSALKLGILKDRLYYRLGNIYFDAEDLDRAEYSYKRAIEENEDHVNAQHNLAVVYRKQGRISESVKQRKKAKKKEMENPKNPDLTTEEKKYARKFAFKLMALLVGGLAGIGLLVYLISRFFF